MAHMARYASTRTGLTRVLERRIDNWAKRARRSGDRDTINAQVAAAKAMIDPIVVKLVAVGVIDDVGFAASRSRRLTREGHSGRAVQAHLAAKGVPPAIARAAVVPDAEREFGACLVAAKKRRLGPFGAGITPELKRREMATLARGGFGERVVRELFALSREEAEEKLIEWRNKVD